MTASEQNAGQHVRYRLRAEMLVYEDGDNRNERHDDGHLLQRIRSRGFLGRAKFHSPRSLGLSSGAVVFSPKKIFKSTRRKGSPEIRAFFSVLPLTSTLTLSF